MFPQQARQGDCVEDLKIWWINCPIFNKFLIMTTILIYFLSFFFIQFIVFLINIPAITIYEFQFQRLFFTPFVHLQLLNLLLSLISIIPSTSFFEKQNGTISLIIDFTIKNVINQSFYCLVIFLISMQNQKWLQFPSMGLWSLVMIFIVQRSMQNPEQLTNFLCFPIMIKQKWYPIAILLLLTILSPQIDLCCSCALGYIEGYFFKGQFLKLSATTLQKIESSFLLSFIVRAKNFVKVSQAGLQSNNLPSSQVQNTSSNDFSPISRMEPPGQTQNPFTGKAVTIGSGQV